MNTFIKENGLYLSFSVALMATIGSLYFSEVMEYPPCTYCWYQRILMYPLVIILGVAAVRKDLKQVIYVIPFALMGLGMSVFHYITQKTSLFAKPGSACGIIPCNTQYINWFDFITIPFLAGVAFTIILILQILILKSQKSV